MNRPRPQEMSREAAVAVADALASARRTLALERSGIAALEAALDERGPDGLGHAFNAATALLAGVRGRIIVTGMGKSGHVGRKVAATLASTGAPATYVHPGEASHGDLGMILREDAVLALSWSGETAELADIITHSRRHQIPLVALTAKADSALGRNADIRLVLPGAEEACPNGLAPTTSTTMQLALGDALAVALLERRGFTAHDFRTLHPGGKLGALLTRVVDVMHTGARLPCVPAGAAMVDAVAEISAKGFGCVAILGPGDRLAGIITDGDLRRHMGPDLFASPVEAVMTHDPTVVVETVMAAEALEMMESRKISVLFVVGEARALRGIVHLHDLLRIGVA